MQAGWWNQAAAARRAVHGAWTKNNSLGQPRFREVTKGCSLGGKDENAVAPLNSGAPDETGIDCSIMLKIIKFRSCGVCPGQPGCANQRRALAVLAAKKTLQFAETFL